MVERLSRLTGIGRRADVRIAPLSRRLTAALIDTPLILGVVGATIGIAVGSVKRTGVGTDPQVFSERLASKPVRLLILLYSGILTMLVKLHQTPGQRVAGIRTADAKSGAPASLRQALILALTPQVKSVLLGRLTRRLRPPQQPAEDHGPALAELRRLHAGDPEARHEATMTYFSEHRQNWSWRGAFVQPLTRAGLTLLIELPARWRWPGRSLGDVLADTALILDR